MAFSDEYRLENRILSHEVRKKQERELSGKAELSFCRYSRDTEKELGKTQGYFYGALVALMISILINFMQWLGHQVPAL
jgi:tetrahydromethanopterin S-methyltransferase subunit G